MIKRIIQVSPAYPPCLGGMENVVKALSEELAKQGFDVKVYTSSKGTHPHSEKNGNLQINYLRSFEFANTPIIVSLFFRLLLLPKESIVHLHIAQAFTPEIVFLACLLKNIPYIAEFHLNVPESSRWGFFLNFYKKHILSIVLQHSQKVICLNSPDKTLVCTQYKVDSRMVQIIPNGVDAKFFFSRRINQRAVTLLYVGRLSVQKNLTFLIEVIKNTKNNVHLRIVGTGNQEMLIRRLISKYHLSNRVNLLGLKVGDELVEEYKKADIFVLTSLAESMPLVLLEAMASGLPLAVPNLDEIKSLIKDCSIIIKSKDPQVYADQLAQLMTNFDLRKKLSVKAKNKAKNYSWPLIVDKIIDIYHDIYFEK